MSPTLNSNTTSRSTYVSLRLLIGLLVLTTTLNVLLPVFIPAKDPLPSEYKMNTEKTGYLGGTFPQEWPIGPLKRVAITVEDSINYRLDTAEGAAQWAQLLPPGGGYVELPGSPQRFRLAMFHQLECLDYIRRTVLARHADKATPAPHAARYCLNYIRQAIMCRADTRLEWVRSEYGGKSVQPFVTHNNCRDWSAVYAEIDRQYPGWNMTFA